MMARNDQVLRFDAVELSTWNSRHPPNIINNHLSQIDPIVEQKIHPQQLISSHAEPLHLDLLHVFEPTRLVLDTRVILPQMRLVPILVLTQRKLHTTTQSLLHLPLITIKSVLNYLYDLIKVIIVRKTDSDEL